MTTTARNVDAILSLVAGHLGAHRIPAAERLLGDLVAQDVLTVATPQQRCRILIEWGWIHGATQRYETARKALGAAVAAAERLRPRDLLCEALRESAVVARYEGDFRTANDLLARAELIARQEGYDFELGHALFLQATIAHHLGEFARAADLLHEAAGAAERCPPAAETEQLKADICRERAVSARVVRDYDAARGLLSEARDRYERLGRLVGVANTERELGAVLEQVADDADARRHYFNAFCAYLRTGRRIGAAQVARRMGRLDLVAGINDHAALERAGRRFIQALRLGSGEPTNAALTTLFRGQLARLQGDLDAAERLLDEAVRLYGGIGGALDVARDLSQVALEYGLVARDRGERAKAVSLFREALRALREADDPGAASLVHYHLAFELIQDDEVSEALQHAV
jgi:tetratricopeptide (TPR) repeat protein